jgi:hypothetical protein
MRTRTLVGGLLVALVSAAGGWLASEVQHAGTLSPGASILAAWESQVAVMTTNAGERREPADVVVGGAYALSALSMGLAAHYDQLTPAEKQALQRVLPRAKAVAPPSGDRRYGAVLGCMEAAGMGAMREECLIDALARE